MRKYIQQNIRVISGYTVGLIIFILILAFIINFITKLDLGFDVSNNSTWISFYATILSAVIGGVISGGLTLLGVIHTIKAQDRKERRNVLPSKMMVAEKISEKILGIIHSYEKYNEFDESEQCIHRAYVEEMKRITKETENNRLTSLEEAASVNFELYDDVFSFYEKIDKINKIINAKQLKIVVFDYDEDSEYISNYKGYEKSLYNKGQFEITNMNNIKQLVDNKILNLRREYIKLSK